MERLFIQLSDDVYICNLFIFYADLLAYKFTPIIIFSN